MKHKIRKLNEKLRKIEKRQRVRVRTQAIFKNAKLDTLLENNRIVAQDVIRAYDIWGPALANLKGLQEEISVLNAQLKVDQIMFVDLMFVNSIPYLISVFKPLEYVSVSKLAKTDIINIYNIVISHINSIRKHGMKITMLRVDGELAINTDWFTSRINAEGIILDTTVAGEAITVVER